MVGLARAGFVAAATATAAPTVCARDCGKSVNAWTRPLLLSFLLLHLLPTPDATADSESSAQSAAQRVVQDPSSRSLSSKVPTVPSDSSLELTS